MFINRFKTSTKITLLLIVVAVFIGVFWNKIFFKVLSISPNDERLHVEATDSLEELGGSVNLKFDKYESVWNNRTVYHSLLSFNFYFKKNLLNEIKDVNFFVDSSIEPVTTLKFEWSEDSTGTYLKYYYSYFFNKERHYENTWYSCDGGICRINIQLYNNYLPVLNGKSHDLLVSFNDGNGSPLFSRKFSKVYFPNNSDAYEAQYASAVVSHNKSDKTFLVKVIPYDSNSWAIIQWVDDNGRSDYNVDLNQMSSGELFLEKFKYSGKISYLAALVYSRDTLSEYKYELINTHGI